LDAPLTAACLRTLRDEYTRTLAAETSTLERMHSELVNQA
jgi:hypothetical protein